MGGHGASAVCKAIVDTARRAAAQREILFSEDTVEKFGIKFEPGTDEEFEQKCEHDFGDIVGSVNAAMMQKEEMEPTRTRRGGHFVGCTNVFANQLCAEFVEGDMGMHDGPKRNRRKGHGASAVCKAIVDTARRAAAQRE